MPESVFRLSAYAFRYLSFYHYKFNGCFLGSLRIDKGVLHNSISECLSILEEQIKEQEVHIAYGNWTEEQTAHFEQLKENKKSLEAQIQALNSTEDYDYTTIISETEDEVT